MVPRQRPAVVAYLLDRNWATPMPSLWQDTRGQTYEMRNKQQQTLVLEQPKLTVEQTVFRGEMCTVGLFLST